MLYSEYNMIKKYSRRKNHYVKSFFILNVSVLCGDKYVRFVKTETFTKGNKEKSLILLRQMENKLQVLSFLLFRGNILFIFIILTSNIFSIFYAE